MPTEQIGNRCLSLQCTSCTHDDCSGDYGGSGHRAPGHEKRPSSQQYQVGSEVPIILMKKKEANISSINPSL